MRLPIIPEDQMTPLQKKVRDRSVASKRGELSWTLTALMHSERMANFAEPLGEFFRFDTSLDKRFVELTILMIARHWTAQNEWHTHKVVALKAGLDIAVIDAIQERKTPHFTKADEETVYLFVKTLHETKTVPADLYDRTQKVLGDKGLVEIIGLLGYYTMVAMVLNVFDFGMPEGVTPLV